MNNYQTTHHNLSCHNMSQAGTLLIYSNVRALINSAELLFRANRFFPKGFPGHNAKILCSSTRDVQH